MNQSEINRAVAQATGETVREIRRRGFSLIDPDEVGFDLEPDDRQPQIVDWDTLDAQRYAMCRPDSTHIALV
jgi:hypothetical protein